MCTVVNSKKLWPHWIKWYDHLRRVQKSEIQNTFSVVICTFPVLFPRLAYLENGGKRFLQSMLHVYQTTQYHIPKGDSLHTNMRKSYLTWIIHISEAGKLAIMMTFTGSQTEETTTSQICVSGQDDSLPPQLQYLVQRALDEIKQEARKGC